MARIPLSCWHGWQLQGVRIRVSHFLFIWPCATPLLKNVRTSLGQPSALMYLGKNYPQLRHQQNLHLFALFAVHIYAKIPNIAKTP